MELQGLHHITMITGDAQKNIDFYADTLGLRLVKKTVNFDAPDAYHLYFADEVGTPGTILTWFEFAGARRGRAGAGQIHTIQLGVASAEALDYRAAPGAHRGAGLRHGRRGLHPPGLPLGLRRSAGRARADGRRHRAPHRLG